MRTLRRGRAGSSGSPPLPNYCPAGLDPRWCDVNVRMPYPADGRFYTCSRCGKKGVFEASAAPEPKQVTSPEPPIAVGDRVRIIEHSQVAYPPPFRGLVGTAIGYHRHGPTGVCRWLVDYSEHMAGRYQVREEHLERVTIAAAAGEQAVAV